MPSITMDNTKNMEPVQDLNKFITIKTHVEFYNNGLHN